MMKSQRQIAILELIARRNIETQEALAEALGAMGIQVTQATVSRDIKELRLIKVLTPEGTYKYAPSATGDRSIADRLARMLQESILTVAPAENLVVVKTLAGSANVAAEALDSLGWQEVVGTIAGDNTVLVICASQADAVAVERRLRGLIP